MNYVDQYIFNVEKALYELKAARQKEWAKENKYKFVEESKLAAEVMYQYYQAEHLGPLDLTERRGDKIIFTENGGYKSKQDYAKRVLKIGEIYVVDSMTITNFNSNVELKEFPGALFNTTMFSKLT